MTRCLLMARCFLDDAVTMVTIVTMVMMMIGLAREWGGVVGIGSDGDGSEFHLADAGARGSRLVGKCRVGHASDRARCACPGGGRGR